MQLGEGESEALYNNYLKQFEKILGKKATSSEELTKVCRSVFGNKYAGTFPRDFITPKTLNSRRKYAIINNETSNEDGEHWVCCAYDKGGIYAYDSYGNCIFSLVPELKQYKRVVNTDRDAEQYGSQANCGARCCSWLYVFDKHGKDVALKI